MLDLIAITSLAVLFGLGVLYTQACERLKGTRP
jgi:hypothetical protein